MIRVGQGYDVHRLVEGRKLVIGGVEIEHEKGLDGHSDADVLLHAISDAILGAASLGDIGKHFPDTDDSYKDADSLELLKICAAKVKEKGYQIDNIDSIIVAQRPKMSPYIEKMRDNIASALGLEAEYINIKATTEEKLGFTGTEQGISAHAIALISKE